MSGLNKVFLVNIPCTVAEDELRDLARSFGRVTEFIYIKDSSGGGEGSGDGGVAVIGMGDKDEAEKFIEGVDGKEIFRNSARPAAARLMSRKLLENSNFFTHPHPVPSAFWSEHKTADGFAYYHNSKSGETVWERPADFRPNSSSFVDSSVGFQLGKYNLYISGFGDDQVAVEETVRELQKAAKSLGIIGFKFLGDIAIISMDHQNGVESIKSKIQNFPNLKIWNRTDL